MSFPPSSSVPTYLPSSPLHRDRHFYPPPPPPPLQSPLLYVSLTLTHHRATPSNTLSDKQTQAGGRSKSNRLLQGKYFAPTLF
ncbi:hypothetical protein E2C01_068681 [Portunus trituberculatus]|uniref:Uncharacterized protein n=1 Tax=Portunus trituberculatus TaxID=210409 RepID=A0A5B7I0R4_PORTR|nr:hypothetical protein [Portunus trituberculatus]